MLGNSMLVVIDHTREQVHGAGSDEFRPFIEMRF
jgi:hypothetical protein